MCDVVRFSVRVCVSVNHAQDIALDTFVCARARMYVLWPSKRDALMSACHTLLRMRKHTHTHMHARDRGIDVRFLTKAFTIAGQGTLLTLSLMTIRVGYRVRSMVS